MDRVVQFRNCRLLRDHHLVEEDLWVGGGKVLDPEKLFFDEKVCADIQIDIGGNILSPGFVDIQINGGFGVDFSCAGDDLSGALDKVSHSLLAHGVTSYCPTLVTSSPETYRQLLPQLRPRKGGDKGATVLGAHIEGPFICPEKKGAHEIGLIQPLPDAAALDRMYGHDLEECGVKLLTLAPELDGALEAIRVLKAKGIAVSLGHSSASLAQGEAAIKAGASLLTHLFNAMPPFHHRDPGLVGLLACDVTPSVFYGIIADGVHTHPAALRMAQRTHPEGLVVVTDAVSPMGLSQGLHYIGGLKVEVVGSRAVIQGTQTLCGSIATMPASVRLLRRFTQCPSAQALEAATLRPATALGIENQKGRLEPGCDADFVQLDDQMQVMSTWIQGQCVYRSPSVPPPLTRSLS